MIHCKLFRACILSGWKDWETETLTRSYHSDKGLPLHSSLFSFSGSEPQWEATIFRMTNQIMFGSLSSFRSRSLEVSSTTTLLIHKRTMVPRD